MPQNTTHVTHVQPEFNERSEEVPGLSNLVPANLVTLRRKLTDLVGLEARLIQAESQQRWKYGRSILSDGWSIEDKKYRDGKFGIQIGSDWLKIGQIRNF